jgi:4-hydroxybenzoate polyprenyltransferase
MLVLGVLGLGIAFLLQFDVLLACVAIIPWIMLYPLAKRWLIIPQLFLAPVFAYSVIVANTLLPHPDYLLWYAASCLWILGFDSAYALSDKADDARLRIHSAPLALGRYLHAFIALTFIGFAAILVQLIPIKTTLSQVLGLLVITLLSWEVIALKPSNSQIVFYANVVVGILIALMVFVGKAS